MKNKLITVFLALIGILAAAPSEKDAESAFAKIVQKFDFSPEPFRKRFKDTDMFVPPYQVESVRWGKTYTENYNGESWTVFVANAVVSTLHGRFSVKVGVGLIQKGGETLMRQATAHEISPAPPPSPNEVKKQGKETDRQANRGRMPGESSFDYYLRTGKKDEPEQDDGSAKATEYRKLAESRIAAAFEARTMSLPTKTNFKAEVSQPARALDSINIQIVKPQMMGNVEVAPTVAMFSVSIDELQALLGGISKWKEWAEKAKQNQVKSFQKSVSAIGSSDATLAFRVDQAGSAFLDVDTPPNAFVSLQYSEAVELQGFLEKLASDLAVAQKKVDELATELANEADKKANLFK